MIDSSIVLAGIFWEVCCWIIPEFLISDNVSGLLPCLAPGGASYMKLRPTWAFVSPSNALQVQGIKGTCQSWSTTKCFYIDWHLCISIDTYAHFCEMIDIWNTSTSFAHSLLKSHEKSSNVGTNGNINSDTYLLAYISCSLWYWANMSSCFFLSYLVFSWAIHTWNMKNTQVLVISCLKSWIDSEIHMLYGLGFLEITQQKYDTEENIVHQCDQLVNIQSSTNQTIGTLLRHIIIVLQRTPCPWPCMWTDNVVLASSFGR